MFITINLNYKIFIILIILLTFFMELENNKTVPFYNLDYTQLLILNIFKKYIDN